LRAGKREPSISCYFIYGLRFGRPCDAGWRFVKTQGDTLVRGRARWPGLLVGFGMLATLAWGAALCWVLIGLIF
jgi:hypothetical protein